MKRFLVFLLAFFLNVPVFSQVPAEEPVDQNLGESFKTINDSTFVLRNGLTVILSKNTSKVIVELQIQDIFSDMAAFSQARDTLQERGYKTVVDGLSPLSLQFFDPGLLKSDFIKRIHFLEPKTYFCIESSSDMCYW